MSTRINHTINDHTDSVTAVFHAILGGKFRIRIINDQGPGHRDGIVLDDNDVPIGSASDYIYAGMGFAVHTRPFGGYVSLDQIEFV
jgi:hypothetical protein